MHCAVPENNLSVTTNALFYDLFIKAERKKVYIFGDTGEWGATQEAPHRKVGVGGSEGNSQPSGNAQGRKSEEEECHHRSGKNFLIPRF